MADLLLTTGVDNSKVPAGLSAFEQLVDAKVKAVQAKLASLKMGAGFNFDTGNLGALEGSFSRIEGKVNSLSGALNRMSGIFTGGMGIGLAIGGFAAFEQILTRSIDRAKQFQTARLSIAAELQNSYKIMGGNGQQLAGPQGFEAAMQKSQKLNDTILARQGRNILTYQEQLRAFQIGLPTGASKNLTPEQILTVSENIAEAAKASGLRQNQIGVAVGQVLSGQNLQRSRIGRVLGITNQDIAGKSGDELVKFIEAKTKGFTAGQGNFEHSIEGILTTLQTRLDVFFAKMGERIFANIAPALTKLEDFLGGEGGSKLADSLVHIFNGLANALVSIANSPAIPIIGKFLEFISHYAGDLLITAAILKFGSVIKGLIGGVREMTGWLGNLGATAAEDAVQMNALAAASTRVGNAASRGAGAGAASTLGRVLPTAAGGFGRASGTVAAGEEAAGAIGIPLFGLGGRFASRRLGQVEGRTLQEAERRQWLSLEANQTRLDASHKSFEEQANFVPQISSQEQTGAIIAQGEARDAESAAAASAASKAAREGRTKAFMSAATQRLGKAASAFVMGFLVTSMLQSAGEGTSFQPVTNSLGAIPATMAAYQGLNGLTVGGMNLGPIAAALGGGYTVGSVIQNSTNGEIFDQEKKSKDNLSKFETDHPQAAKIAALRAQMARVQNNASLSPEYTAKREKALRDQISDIRNGYNATEQADSQKAELNSAVQNANFRLEGARLGFGNTGEVQGLESALNIAKVKQMAQTGTLNVTSADQIAGSSIFNKANRGVELFKGIAPNQAIPDDMLKNTDIGTATQTAASQRLIAEIQAKQAFDMQKLALEKQKSLAEVGPGTKIDQQFQSGKIGAQASALETGTRIGLVGSDLQNYVVKSVQKFVDDFDIDSKKVQAQIEALKLGGGPQDFAKVTTLMIQEANDKIEDLGKEIGLSAQKVQELQQQSAVNINFQRALEMLNGGWMKMEEKYEKAVRRKTRELNDLDFNRGLQLTERQIQFQGFDRSGRKIGEGFQRAGQDYDVNSQDAQLGLQTAMLAAQRAHLSPWLNLQGAGQGIQEQATGIREKVDADIFKQKNPSGFNAGQYEAKYRQSRAIDDQEEEIKRQQADIAVERAGLNIFDVEKAYTDSLESLTDQVQQRALEMQKAAKAANQQDYDYNEKRPELVRDLATVQGATNFTHAIDNAAAAPSLTTKAGGGEADDKELSVSLPINGLLDTNEFRKYLAAEVPTIIKAFIRNTQRSPKP